MKKVTRLRIEKSEQFLARSFIDRIRTSQSAIQEEQRKIIKEASVTAAYLYNYYVGICNIPSWDLTDDGKVAKQTGLSVRKVSDTRRLLTNLGWIRFDVHTHGSVRYGLWYIGKEVVAMKIGRETTIEEYHAVGMITDEEYEVIK
jgi:hypothetical protein